MPDLIIILICGGLFAGFTAGLFGIGGGSFLIPLFIYLLPKLGTNSAQVMHQAVATSLAIIIPSTLSASFKQYRQGNIDQHLLKSWIPFVLLGLLVVMFFFNHISSKTLQVIFIVYLCICALYMLLKKPLSNDTPAKVIPFISYATMGFTVGALSVLLGVGGGTVTVPYFTYYQYPLKKAIALSSVTGVFVGLFGTLFMIFNGLHAPNLAQFSLGYVNILSVLMLSPFCIIAANYGAKVSNQLSESVFKILYVIFLVGIIAFIYFNAK